MNKFVFAAASLGLLIASGSVLAKDKAEWRSWPLGQRLSVGVSAYRPSIDTEVDLFAGPIQGSISFEQNLGLEDTTTSPLVDLRWRFFKRHTFTFDYYNLDRSGAGFSPANVSVCPENDTCIDLPLEWPVNTTVDVEVFDLGYEYSLVFNEKVNWGVGLGLSWQDFSVSIITDDPFPPGEEISVESGFAAPLPSLATSFSYAFTDKWILDAGLNWLKINLDIGNNGNFDGSLWAFDLGIRWQTFEHVGFTLAYTSFDLDVEVSDEPDLGGLIKYKYKGPRLGVNVYF
jgi:hypothetical protein